MYKISEDSIFFSEFLYFYLKKKKNKEKIKFLDIGTGTGILAETALKSGINLENIHCSDINKKAVSFVIKKGFNCIKSDLFFNISQKYDIITFNAPYLPEDLQEPEDSRLETTGGKLGDEISLKFLKQAKEHLNNNGKILLLVSSLTPLNKINKFKPKITARKKLWMEELMILEFN